MRRLISSGSIHEETFGYSRAVRDGRHVCVSGTTGFDYATMTISEDPAEQADRALRNIETSLAEAGARIADLARIRFILPDPPTSSRVRPSSAVGSASVARPRRCSWHRSWTRA